jgi:hypothetical protein
MTGGAGSDRHLKPVQEPLAIYLQDREYAGRGGCACGALGNTIVGVS